MSGWRTVLNLSPDLYGRVRDIARQRGITVDEAVAELLAERLKHEPVPEKPN